MARYPHPLFRTCAIPFGFVLFIVSVHAQYNDWISAASGNWDNAANWSSGLPHFSQLEVRIINPGSKAVVINPTTPINFPSSMTVQNLRVGGWPPNTNLLLMNFFGTTLPLRVLQDMVIEANGRVSLLYSGLNVSNMIHLHGWVEQEGGELVFTNSPASTMQIDGGRLNLTSGYVFGRNMYLGGANDGYVDASGLVQLDWLVLGSKPSVPGSPAAGTYILQNGWLIVGVHEGIGGTGLGTLIQNGGTNSATGLAVGNGNYVKNGGALFAGQVRVLSPSGVMTHAGGTATIENVLRLAGQAAQPLPTFNMFGGSLSTPRIQLEASSVFTQTNGTVNVFNELSIENGPGFQGNLSVYSLSGGNLFVGNTSIGSYPSASFDQSGGTHFVTNQLTILNQAIYRFSGGAMNASTIVLSGNFPNPPQFRVLGATPYTITNHNISLHGAAIVIQDSAQQFGRLTLPGDSSINLAGGSAILRFADSRTNSWDSQLVGVIPRLRIIDWNGSTNGGGPDQLVFGTNSSALTASQLAQIDFINPAGFPPGTNHGRILATGEVVPDQASGPGGIVNSWINPGSGNWDVPSNWSLGLRPDSSQAVMITNSGWKAVSINASTPVNFPASMTVSNLTVRGAFDARNTLLLNFFGTTVPLTVLNGLTVADNAQILNFNSGLDVLGGTVTVTNAQIVQDGGYVGAFRATMNLFNSEYHLTNGLFEAGSMLIGFERDSHFNQYGGTALITNLSFAFTPGPGTGTRGIRLYGGNLNLPVGLRLEGRGGSTAAYLQEGGTNRTSDILLMPGLTGPSPSFTLNGGLLADNNVNVWADTIITRFRQNGGTHTVSNLLQLTGGTRTGTIRPAIYELNGGTLAARSIILDSRGGDAIYIQSNGVARAGQIFADGFPFSRSDLVLAGGALSSSDLFLTNGANLHQYGGALVVSNTLRFDGYREPGPRIYSRYELFGGTLVASNMIVGGDWIIGDSATNRISNPGTVSLSQLLVISNAVEQLGRFSLANNATINLAGSASRLSFANSGGQVWTPGATLIIANWNGNVSGGGAEQLRFGTNQAGVTMAQLNQIRFRIGNDLLSARILSTGEVIPDQLISPSVNLEFSKQGNSLVLTWPEGWFLQTATNVVGPYLDVADATSPYTNNVTVDPQRFFRLRSAQ